MSVSEDIVKVWSLNEESCVNELNSSGRKFSSCAFHPIYPSLLVIGCYQASHFLPQMAFTHDSSKTGLHTCMDLSCLWLNGGLQLHTATFNYSISLKIITAAASVSYLFGTSEFSRVSASSSLAGQYYGHFLPWTCL